jgi:predicted kinase
VTRVFVTMGIPGSGKSYAVDRLFGNEDNLAVIRPDDIRAELCGDAADQSRNSDVFSVAHARLRDALMDEKIDWAVFDATNIKKFARQNLLAICQEFGAEAALVIFDIPFEICAVRNEERDRTVPADAMLRMQVEFEEAIEEVQFESWERIGHIVRADEEGVQLLADP